MVAKLQITTVVDPDGSVHLSGREMERAGIHAGDRILVAIVRAPEPTAPSLPDIGSVSAARHELNVAELAALPFDEWLEYGRSRLSFDGLTVEEIRRQAEEAAADEWWERFNRDE